jgi:MFS family permease
MALRFWPHHVRPPGFPSFTFPLHSLMCCLSSVACWGYLADRIRNRKIPMLFGLILLSGSTVFLCVARNIAMLLVGRVLQGLSAALTWTVGLALVVDTVDAQHIGQAMGWIGMATSIGIMIAPLLGGVVYDRGGYYAVFAMCFGLLAVDIMLRLAIVEVKEASKWLPESEEHGMDTAMREPVQKSERHRGQDIEQVPADDNPGVREKGAISSEPDAPTQTSTPNISPAAGRQGGIFGAVKPFLNLLSKPRLLAALWGTLVHSIIQTSFDSTLPLLVESLFHWDSIGAGLIFLPVVLPAFLSPLIGALSDRYGPKWLATGGFLIATPFLVCLRFVEHNTIENKVMLCGLLVGVGITIALVFGPLMAEITWSVTEDEEEDASAMSVAPYAQAYGLYNMAFSGGALVGPIMGGLIRDSAGWPTVCWVLGLVTAVTAVTQFFWVGRPVELKFPGLKR